MQNRTVFLSSTAKDLQEYREAAYKAIEGLDGYHCVRMENFGARDQEADEFCAAKVAECDLFVGIVGHLYGSCPKGSETSYTEMEYNAAVDASKPRLIFVAPEGSPISAELRESDDKWQKQKSFRECANKERIHAEFNSPDNLAWKITQAIQNKITNTKKEGTSVSLQRPSRPKLFVGQDGELEALIPNQIPRSPADFKGREEEISEILSNFDKGATITGLRGMAGVGKTALALVLAERLRDRFSDGHLFLNLKGTTKKPLSTAEAMAQVVHSYYPTERLPENENELHGLYLSVLAGKRALLLLDNAADKEQVEPLLPPSNCAVLITSRNKFTLPGLKERDLDVLPPGEARELLLEIAGRIGDRADSLAKLCGYLPLALRNAASALAERKDIDVKDYERRLGDKKARLELVEASFSLSYELLSPMRRKHWCRLSVFPEDFDLSGGIAVLKMSRDASAEALSDLVKWSLVNFICSVDLGEGRYRLHDLACIFAESRLESKEHDDAKQRLIKHYLKVLSDAEKLYDKGGKNIREGLMLFDREWANIKEGQAWAEVMMQNIAKSKKKSGMEFALQSVNSYPNDGCNVLALRQHPQERIRWLETALTATRLIKKINFEGAHLINLGLAYADLGEGRKAIEYYDRALAISRKIGDRYNEGAALGDLGSAYMNLGEMHKAIEYYDMALAISREIGDRRGEGADLGNLGIAYADLGEVRKAIEYYEQALAISREIEDRRSEGNHLGNLGIVYYHLGEVCKAIEYYEQALAISREIGDRQGEGNALGNLGIAYADLGEVRKAIEYNEQALVISRRIGDRRGEGNRLGTLGSAYMNLGEVRKAIEYYNQALKIACEIGNRRSEGNSLDSLGLAYADLGETRKAIEYYEQALAISREIGNPSMEGENLCNFGKAYAALGEIDKAIGYYEQSLEIVRKIEDRKKESDALCNLGKAYAALGEVNKAIDHFEQSLEIARKIEYRRVETDALFNMSLALDKLGQRPEAIDRAKAALEIFEQIESPDAEMARQKLSEWQ
jgi:tetratricopeptide (TPR) repeat protein